VSGPGIPTGPSGLVAGPEEFRRILWRLAKELQERHPLGEGVTLCGIATRGVHLAERIREMIREQGGGGWTAVALDVGPYRDDQPRPPIAAEGNSTLPAADPPTIRDRVVVLIDDVLYHGRTARAALAAVAALGRPASVELLVMVDRGHRELPLRATYVGRNLPTSPDQRVYVHIRGCDDEDAIRLGDLPDRAAG
jgi:pyrimidine operon attenuation protein/uracil phosphoribosyltransferase